MIKVSVLMMTYGHQDFIIEAINGVLIQECNFEIELIVADDNSPDNTEKVVSDFIKNHPRKNIIKYTKHKNNKGMLKNDLWALGKAKGEYIALCEGDDYWTDPLKLQKQVDFLNNNMQYVITYSDIQPFNEKGDLKNIYGGSVRDLTSDDLIKATPLNTQTVCFRNIITDVPKEIYGARIVDLFFWSLLGHYGKGKYLSEVKPTRYRVHDGGIFSKKDKKTKLEMWLLTANSLYAYYQRIGNLKLTDYYRIKSLNAGLEYAGKKEILKMIFKKGFIKLLLQR